MREEGGGREVARRRKEEKERGRGREGHGQTDTGAKRTDARARNWDDGRHSAEGEGGPGLRPLRPGG